MAGLITHLPFALIPLRTTAATRPTKTKNTLTNSDARSHRRVNSLATSPPARMIHFFLVQNRMGKTRLCKWYVPCDDTERERQKTDVHRLITLREMRLTNVVEYRTMKVVYRRYAGLYFSFCVDVSDNELAYLELIQFFVETLDHFFGNVCELDIVYQFHRVYMILDELILAGEIQEVSKPTIVERVQSLGMLK